MIFQKKASESLGYQTLMSSRYLQKIAKDEIELVYASSVMAENYAELASDGDKATRWESVHGAEPAWLAFSFKEPEVISSMKIYWEAAGSSTYDIQMSLDGENWTNVFSVTDGLGAEDRAIKFDSLKTKFIRILMRGRVTEYGFSIYEVEFNPLVILPENRVSLTDPLASTQGTDNFANKAIDGDLSTRWESEQGVDPQWITVRLLEPADICAVKIAWETAAAKNYQVLTSENGKSWKKQASISDGKDAETRLVEFDKPVRAGYIKILGKTRSTQYGYSIFELEAYKI